MPFATCRATAPCPVLTQQGYFPRVSTRWKQTQKRWFFILQRFCSDRQSARFYYINSNRWTEIWKHIYFPTVRPFFRGVSWIRSCAFVGELVITIWRRNACDRWARAMRKPTCRVRSSCVMRQKPATETSLWEVSQEMCKDTPAK